MITKFTPRKINDKIYLEDACPAAFKFMKALKPGQSVRVDTTVKREPARLKELWAIAGRVFNTLPDGWQFPNVDIFMHGYILFKIGWIDITPFSYLVNGKTKHRIDKKVKRMALDKITDNQVFEAKVFFPCLEAFAEILGLPDGNSVRFGC